MIDNNKFDVVIVGAGHNGLISAAYLAKSGVRVLCLEAAGKVGGASATVEFSDGYSVSECAHFLYALHPKIVSELQLKKHGLSYAGTDLSTIALGEDGHHIHVKGGAARGEKLSTQDAKNYQEFHALMTRFSKVLATTLLSRPPKMMNGNFQDKLMFLKLGWQVKRLGKRDMQELLRIGAINIYDVLNEHFENPLLKGALSLDSVLGSHTGPRSPNTVLAYLYRHVGETFGFSGPAIPTGGMGGVSEAMASAARSLGAVIRTSSRVADIMTKDSKIVGVKLEDDEEIKSGIVISNADPRTTFADLVGYPQVETDFSRRIMNIRMKGNSAKLHLALDGLPQFTGLEDSEIGNRLLIAPDPDYVERAFNHAKYNEYSQNPIIEISIPTVHDSSLAPAGKHVLSAVVQYAPHNLSEGWSTGNEKFMALVVDTIEGYAPGIKQLIVGSEMLSPVDIESRFSTTAGHWHHGELALDQFLMLRPFPGMSQYSTPIEGLYLCSAGNHPGGNVMGFVGRNCAQAVLKNGVG